MYRAPMRMKKTLQIKWNKRLKSLHIAKVTNARARVDLDNPVQGAQGFGKSKKNQLIEGIT